MNVQARSSGADLHSNSFADRLNVTRLSRSMKFIHLDKTGWIFFFYRFAATSLTLRQLSNLTYMHKVV